MFSRRTALLAALGSITLGSAIVVASPKPPFAGHLFAQAPVEQRDRMRDGWLKDLNLTPDQMQKIRAIRSRYKDQLSQQRQAVQQAQKELKTLMVGNTSDDQIRQKYEQLKPLRQNLADTRFNSLLEIRDVLTPEQRQKFVDRFNKRHEGFRERMKNQSDQQLGAEETENLAFNF